MFTAYYAGIVTQPVHGTLVVDNGVGFMTYKPDYAYSGTDSFTFDAYNSNWAGDQATVSIIVDHQAPAPVLRQTLGLPLQTFTQNRVVDDNGQYLRTQDVGSVTVDLSKLLYFADGSDNAAVTYSVDPLPGRTITLSGSTATVTLTDASLDDFGSTSPFVLPFTVTDPDAGGFGIASFTATGIAALVYAESLSTGNVLPPPPGWDGTLGDGGAVALGSGLIVGVSGGTFSVDDSGSALHISRLGGSGVGSVSVETKDQGASVIYDGWPGDVLTVSATNGDIGDVTTGARVLLSTSHGSLTGTIDTPWLWGADINGDISGRIESAQVGRLTADGNFSGTINAGSVDGLILGGDLSGDITTSGDMGRIDGDGSVVGGAMTGKIMAGGQVYLRVAGDLRRNVLADGTIDMTTGVVAARGAINVITSGGMSGSLDGGGGVSLTTGVSVGWGSYSSNAAPDQGDITGTVKSEGGEVRIICSHDLTGLVHATAGTIAQITVAGELAGAITIDHGNIDSIWAGKNITGDITAGESSTNPYTHVTTVVPGSIGNVYAGLNIGVDDEGAGLCGITAYGGTIGTVHAGADIAAEVVIAGDLGVGTPATETKPADGVVAGHDLMGRVVASEGPIYYVRAGRNLVGGIGGIGNALTGASDPTLTIASLEPSVLDVSSDEFEFKFTRSGSTDLAVEVQFAITNDATIAYGVDYTLDTDRSSAGVLVDSDTLIGKVTFAAGQRDADVIFKPVYDENLADPANVTVTAQTTEVPGADGGFAGGPWVVGAPPVTKAGSYAAPGVTALVTNPTGANSSSDDGEQILADGDPPATAPVPAAQTAGPKDRTNLDGLHVTIRWTGPDLTERDGTTIVQGADITGKSLSIEAGQRVMLEMVLTAPEHAGAIRWDVPGFAVGDYNPDKDHAIPDPVVNGRSDVKLYWADSGAHKVSVSCKVGQLELSNFVDFSVAKPNVAITAAVSPKGVELTSNNKSRVLCLQLGNFDFGKAIPIDTVGVEFSIQSPLQFKGSYCWIQTIDMSINMRDVDNGAHPFSISGFDNETGDWTRHFAENPYTDSPYHPLEGHIKTYKVCTVREAFHTYLMYVPPGAGSIPVPVRVETWNWYGFALKKTDGAWDLVARIAPKLKDAAATDFPTWGVWVNKEYAKYDAGL